MIAKLLGWRGLAVLALLLVIQTGRLSHAKHDLKGSRAQATKAIGDWTAMHDAIVNPKTGWIVAYKRLEAARKADATQAASNIDTASTQRAAATSSAFDQGYAAGRTAGRKSCGVSYEKAPPAASGGAAPVGVRPRPEDDLAALWRNGAYQPR